MPSSLDHYLASYGYESQQLPEPEDPKRPNNLWKPVRGDHGAHGSFDSGSNEGSPFLWADTHRDWLGAAAIAAAGVAAWAFRAARRPVPEEQTRRAA